MGLAAIERGLAALERAERLGGAQGPYALQAAIAACHARAVRADDTDWAHIAALYAILGLVTPSPIVELNRAVAVSMAHGPQAGLDLVDALAVDPALRDYHLLPERARRPAREARPAGRSARSSSSAPPRSRATSASAQLSNDAGPRRRRAGAGPSPSGPSA